MIRHVGIGFPPITITGSGSIDLDGERNFRHMCHPARLPSASFPKASSWALCAGILEATLDMKGRMKDRGSWRTSGHIRFDEGTIHVEDSRSPSATRS